MNANIYCRTPKVCRACLAMNVKMYPMSEYKLSVMYEKVTGVRINTEDKLPGMLCWECAARLSSANNFIEKSLKTHWILLEKSNGGKLITIDDIESINKAQYQLESTLGFKFYVNNYSLHIKRECDITDDNGDATNIELINDKYVNSNAEFCKPDEEFNKAECYEPDEKVDIDSHHETEKIFVNSYDEVLTIKSENFDITEQKEEDFQTLKPIIDIKGNLYHEEATIYNMDNMNEMLEEDNKDDIKKDARNKGLHDCKELRVVLEDVKLSLNEQSVQDSFKQLNYNVQSTKDNKTVFQKKKLKDDNKFVKTLKNIDTHFINDVDVESSNKLFICDICDKSFQNKTELITHIQEHLNCEKYNKGKQLLDVNAKLTRKNDFKCSYCNYKTNRNLKLSSHVNSIHTKSTVFSCSYCSHKTYRKDCLIQHINSRHIKSNVYNCSYCSYKTFRKGDLNVHVNAKHTKKRVFICSYCSYETCRKAHLNIHTNNMHTRNIVFNCSYCSYKAYSPVNFRLHVKKHLKVK